MVLNWFSTKEVDAFADSVITELGARFPESGVDVSTKKSTEKALQSLDRILVSIGTFAAQRRPNLYQKARFGNRIKWGLKERGYPQAFIDVVTHEFLKQLTLSATRKRGA